MSLLIETEIKIILAIFLRTVYTVQEIPTKQKELNFNISIWVHSLVVLFIILNLLFMVYIIKNFLKRQYRQMDEGLYNVNETRLYSQKAVIVFSTVLDPRRGQRLSLQPEKSVGHTKGVFVNTHMINILKNKEGVLGETALNERGVPILDKFSFESCNTKGHNCNIENNTPLDEPEISKYIYDSYESLVLDKELDRIYNHKWYEESISNTIGSAGDTASDCWSSVSYHEGEVYSIAINGDPNINNITAKEAMMKIKLQTFTEK